MEILGMGPMEILLIVVLALIVFGPARLPEIMGQVGRVIADFRRTTSELSGEFNRTIQAELQETRAMVDDTRSAVTGVHTSINAAISGTPAPTLTAPAPAPTLTNGTNGTNGTHPVSSPSLADTSQWNWESTAPAPAGPAVSVADPPVSVPKPDIPAPVARRKPSRTDDLVPPY